MDELFAHTIQMLLGINEAQAWRVRHFVTKYELDYDFDYAEASLADLKGFYTLVWNEYIEHRTTSKGEQPNGSI